MPAVPEPRFRDSDDFQKKKSNIEGDIKGIPGGGIHLQMESMRRMPIPAWIQGRNFFTHRKSRQGRQLPGME